MAHIAVDNNAFEIIPSPRNKRKISAPNPNVYMNPALDLLATEDKMCNTTMEVLPMKRVKRSKSCGDNSAFENPCLVGEGKLNNVLARELWNVKHNVLPSRENQTRMENSVESLQNSSGITFQNCIVTVHNTVNVSPCVAPKEINRNVSVNLSFIDRLGLNSPECSSANSLYLDDDLNESNIMEIKSIKGDASSIIIPDRNSTNPFINCSSIDAEMELENDSSTENQLNNFPFDISTINPFTIVPRRLFCDDSSSTIVSEELNELPSILKHSNRSKDILNKQSKILGCDVSKFKERDILNINDDVTTDSFTQRAVPLSRGKNKKPALKVTNTLSKKVLKKLKHAFKHEKYDSQAIPSGNPYEVPRKQGKIKDKETDSGFENPGLSLDCSDVEVEEVDSENDSRDGYNFTNVLQINKHGTPPREVTFKFKCNKDIPLRELSNLELHSVDVNSETLNKKHVRFDTTLNQEKIITGNSFDSFDSVNLEETIPVASYDDSANLTIDKINSELDDFHDELENCMNEKKFLQQNL